MRADDSRMHPPIELPYYGAPFVAAVRRFFVKYFTFSGRAGRAEFWWPTLLIVAFPIVVRIVKGVTTGDWRQVDVGVVTDGFDAIALLVALTTFIPALAATWRRLHDTGRSGAWFFLTFVPVAGLIVLIVMLAMPPNPEGRRFDRGEGMTA